MKDWGELWLNEGFATYFENVGASLARPNFAYYDTFYSDFATTAMEEDAYPKSTHPLATLTGREDCDIQNEAHQIHIVRKYAFMWAFANLPCANKGQHAQPTSI